MSRGVFLVVLACVACVRSAHARTRHAAVAELDAASLLTALANVSVVVTFYTRWCGLCSAFEPEFERVAAAFANASAPGVSAPLFGRVDVDAHRPVAKSFGVTSVPFVALLQPGTWFTWDDATGEPVPLPASRFESTLAADVVVAWLNNSTGWSVLLPAQVEELTPATLREAQQDIGSDVLVEYYGKGCSRCQDFEAEYNKVGAHFAHSAVQRVARVDVHQYPHLVAEHNLTGLPSFVLFPRGTSYRETGLRFRGAHSSRALVEFVASPAVYLLEADVVARGAECINALLARGLVQFASEELNNSQRAQAVVDAAHHAATAHSWADALEALLCIAATPALRRTGIGSAPALWHLLDNAKLNYERAALQRIGYARDAAEDAGAASLGIAAEIAESDEAHDHWGQFDLLAAQRAAALNERGILADEL